MDEQTIAKRLVALRGGKSQKKVAEDLGISVSAIGMYETGARIPKDDIKVKIARYYGKSVEEMFYGSSLSEKSENE